MRNLLFAPLLWMLTVHNSAISQSYVPQWNNPKNCGKAHRQHSGFCFSLECSYALGKPVQGGHVNACSYLLSLDPDRFLSGFRSHAGLKSKAVKYGGWESSGLAGHTLGHYLTALSLHYTATGDVAFLKRINYIVDENWRTARKPARRAISVPFLMKPRYGLKWQKATSARVVLT